MIVEVRLGARLGPGRRRVELAAGATAGDVVAALAPDLGLEHDRLRGVSVAVSGEVVGRDHPLREGEAITLVLPVAGG